MLLDTLVVQVVLMLLAILVVQVVLVLLAPGTSGFPDAPGHPVKQIIIQF